jgi:hypothetical protein
MNASDAGRRGGQQKSAAKRSAARRNGTRGGRPRKADALLQRMAVLKAKIDPLKIGIDPDDLDLIIERLCRLPGDGRRFFIHPRQAGGYDF